MPQQKIIKKSASISEKVSNANVVEASINSPLQRFVRAKKKINQTFEEILSFLKDSRKFLSGSDISDHCDNETQKDLKQIDNFLSQVVNINEMLKRDHMKVAFFGRTSNGKSTVINSMLSERILPAGIGHTTNCFLSVIGAEGEEAYMEDTSKQPYERKSVESLQQLAHALHNQKLDSSSHLKVYWPTSKCPLLKDDVVFVDSPGVDVTPDLDTWIDKHCLDADVFVLVVNSESTINHTEKSFFHKVNDKLSKPNVFILNNRWDASADGDPEMIKLVKQQHLERTTEFLVDELKCVSAAEAADRVFFVSALETLRHRMSLKKLQLPERQLSIEEDHQLNAAEYRMGKIARRQEFEDFEHKFKECISKSAINTKFNGHTSKGISIAKEMVKIMENLLARASSQRQWCTAEREDQQETLDFINTKMKDVTAEIKTKIQNITEEVELHVTKAMSEEIRRLGNLVGEFDYPFHPHSGFLRNYKKELHAYIEKGLGTNLKARCSAPLLESIEEYKSEMQDQVFSLIPTSACTSTLSTLSPRTNFAVSYELDVANLCSDFHEDITFRFSLGWTRLVTKYVAPRNPRLALLLGAAVKQGMHLTHERRSFDEDASRENQMKAVPSQAQPRHTGDEEDNDEHMEVVQSRYTKEDEMLTSLSRHQEDQLTVAVIQGLGSLGSTTAMGLVVAGSLVWRAVGWKLIACAVAGYATVYMYERAMWTNAAKEKTFKKQFVEYASEKLQLIVSFTSKGCSHQIQQELAMAFAQLGSQVDSAKEKVRQRIEELDDEIKCLGQLEVKAKLNKNKASWFETDLNSFMKEFNLGPSPSKL